MKQCKHKKDIVQPKARGTKLPFKEWDIDEDFGAGINESPVEAVGDLDDLLDDEFDDSERTNRGT